MFALLCQFEPKSKNGKALLTFMQFSSIQWLNSIKVVYFFVLLQLTPDSKFEYFLFYLDIISHSFNTNFVFFVPMWKTEKNYSTGMLNIQASNIKQSRYLIKYNKDMEDLSTLVKTHCKMIFFDISWNKINTDQSRCSTPMRIWGSMKQVKQMVSQMGFETRGNALSSSVNGCQ